MLYEISQDPLGDYVVTPLDVDEYDRWMRSATRTLESAKHDADHGGYNWASFKAHQAAEKALKALLWVVSVFVFICSIYICWFIPGMIYKPRGVYTLIGASGLPRPVEAVSPRRLAGSHCGERARGDR